MSAFYFGSSDRPLFGVYHPPAERPVRRAGVLICNALGREYLRTHRTLRQLAIRLTEAGYHVLRFDYSGTGDSAGRGGDATLRRWEEDADLAADELEAIGGVRRIRVVGVRLGGAVAATLAADRSDVDDLALWDPVVRGDRYLAEVLDDGARAEEAIAAAARADAAPFPAPGTAPGTGSDGPTPAGGEAPGRRADRDDPDDGPGATPPDPGRGPDRGVLASGPSPEVAGAGGFPLGAAMREQIAGVRLDRTEDPGVRRALLVTTEEREPYRALGRRLRERTPSFRSEHRPGAEGWEDPGRMGTVVLVPAVVGTIVDHLAEEDR